MDYNAVRFFNEQAVPKVPEGNELVIVAWRFKTPENLGGIMRLAGNLGIETVLAVESHVGNVNFDKIKRIARTAFGYAELETVAEADILERIPLGFSKVALETAPDSRNLFSVALPSRMALFVGNEQAGLPPYLVGQCDLSVHIPLPGGVKSMNAAQAATVAAFEWYRQQTVVK